MNSQSVLTSSDVLVHEQGSEAGHSGLDLEFNIIREWLSWVGVSSLINIPGLVETIVASPHMNISSVSVAGPSDIQANLVVE